MPNKLDLSGMRFGMLVVASEEGRDDDEAREAVERALKTALAPF